MSIEAMQQALNALKCFQSDAYETSEKRGLWLDAEIASLHQAIEQAEQIEPEDWRHHRHFHEQAEKQQALDKKADNARELGLDYESTHTDHPMRHWDRTCPACVEQAEKQEPKRDKPLRLSPMYEYGHIHDAELPWVGLNWDDIPDVFVGDIAFMQGAKWALAKLKEKNGG